MNESQTRLETTRLWLLPGHRQHDEALRQGAAVFEKQFSLPVAAGITDFVQPESKDAIVAAEWDRFLIVQKADQKLIGLCACRKQPDANGAVEIAYGIAPGCQGQGLATEAAQALTGLALARPNVRAVKAHTLPEPNASTRVLIKCGFRLIGEIAEPEDGPVWKWEKHR